MGGWRVMFRAVNNRNHESCNVQSNPRPCLTFVVRKLLTLSHQGLGFDCI